MKSEPSYEPQVSGHVMGQKVPEKSVNEPMQRVASLLGSHLAQNETIKALPLPPQPKTATNAVVLPDNLVANVLSYLGLNDLCIHAELGHSYWVGRSAVNSLHQLIADSHDFDTAQPCLDVILNRLQNCDVVIHATTQLFSLIETGQFDEKEQAVSALLNLSRKNPPLVGAAATRRLIGLMLQGKFEKRLVELSGFAARSPVSDIDKNLSHAANKTLQQMIKAGTLDAEPLYLHMFVVGDLYPAATKHAVLHRLPVIINGGGLDDSGFILQLMASENATTQYSDQVQQAASNRLSWLANQNLLDPVFPI